MDHPRARRRPRAFIRDRDAPIMDALNQSMLTQALTWVRRWERTGLAVSVSVNLPGGALADPGLADRLSKLVRGNGVEPGSLVIEVTETTVSRERALAIETLARLRMAGFGLSLDDYGTGYASMEMLKTMPVTEVKVDRRFVHGASRDPKATAVLGSLLELASGLSLSVVAEGVETQEDLVLLDARVSLRARVRDRETDERRRSAGLGTAERPAGGLMLRAQTEAAAAGVVSRDRLMRRVVAIGALSLFVLALALGWREQVSFLASLSETAYAARAGSAAALVVAVRARVHIAAACVHTSDRDRPAGSAWSQPGPSDAAELIASDADAARRRWHHRARRTHRRRGPILASARRAPRGAARRGSEAAAIYVAVEQAQVSRSCPTWAPRGSLRQRRAPRGWFEREVFSRRPPSASTAPSGSSGNAAVDAADDPPQASRSCASSRGLARRVLDPRPR
jgi:hypothetical protein